MQHTKTWTEFVDFDCTGQPMWQVEIETLDLTHFEEFFISYLADALPGLEEDPCTRYEQFKDLYVQCRLDAQHEYDPNTALSP